LEARVVRFLANEPDDLVDRAIVAYQDDQMVAPPDIVIPQWGKSRLYTLKNVTNGTQRHQVLDAWFENNCSLQGLLTDDFLAHFWTEFQQERTTLLPETESRGPRRSIAEFLRRGLRLRLKMPSPPGSEPALIEVHHLQDGLVGCMAEQISAEIQSLCGVELRYLPLVDALYEQDAWVTCKMLVTIAGPAHAAEEIAAHAESAFFAERAHC
jgi:hypothetical protein